MSTWDQGPGRIDKMFHLNYMVGEQACKMIAHYFQQDTNFVERCKFCEMCHLWRSQAPGAGFGDGSALFCGISRKRFLSLNTRAHTRMHVHVMYKNYRL